MTSHTRRAGVLACALAVLPAALASQARPTATRVAAPAATPGAEQSRAQMAELRTIAARLQGIHARAMRTGDLAATQATLMRDIKSAMERQDPELPRLATRVKAMEAEARTAETRNDVARKQALAREFATIQSRFMRAQQAVMRQSVIARRARAFDERLHRRMVASDAQTDQSLARSRQLQPSLHRALAAQGQTGPAAGARRTP